MEKWVVYLYPGKEEVGGQTFVCGGNAWRNNVLKNPYSVSRLVPSLPLLLPTSLIRSQITQPRRYSTGQGKKGQCLEDNPRLYIYTSGSILNLFIGINITPYFLVRFNLMSLLTRKSPQLSTYFPHKWRKGAFRRWVWGGSWKGHTITGVRVKMQTCVELCHDTCQKFVVWSHKRAVSQWKK